MTPPKRGLGALLSATTQSTDPVQQPLSAEVPIAAIRPNPTQPRTYFDPVALGELAASIKERGLIQPVVVRPLRPEEIEGEAKYELIAGERRWRASQLAALTTIPALVKPVFDEREIMLLSLIENLQRDDLNPLEEARAYQRMVEKFNLTHDQVAAGIGKSRAHISNLIRLMVLPPAVLEAIGDYRITPGHAKVLLSLPDPGLQNHFAAKIQAQHLSIRDLERAVLGTVTQNPTQPGAPLTPARETTRHRGSRGTRMASPEIQALEQQMREHYGTRVTIEESLHKGRIIIEFYSAKDLQRIVDFMNLD